MEHQCPRCGGSVEDGSPFCFNCEAAQIRYTARPSSGQSVTIPSSSAALNPALLQSADSYGPPSAIADSSAGLRAALYGGLIAAVLSSLPLGAVFFLVFPFAGFMSVRLYRRWAKLVPRTRIAFRLGALAGVFGFVGLLVLTAIHSIVFSAQNEIREALLEVVRQQQARAVDPQSRQMLDYFTSPQGMAFMIIFGFLFMGIVFVLFSGIGAAVSASLLRRKGPPQQ